MADIAKNVYITHSTASKLISEMSLGATGPLEKLENLN